MSELRAERTDLDIEADIEHVLAHYPPLTHDRPYLEVTVQNGVVTVNGSTRTGITRRYLVDALRRIPDVARVEANGLFSDDTIRLEVGRLIPPGVIANVMHGTVILTGSLPGEVNAMELIAAVDNVPGVRAVRTQFN
jgi:osmotically-inducible protein OsmY